MCLNSEAAPRPVARSNMNDGSPRTFYHLCLKLFCCCCPCHNLSNSYPIKLFLCPGCRGADKLASSAIHLSRWQISLRVSLSLFPPLSSNIIFLSILISIYPPLPSPAPHLRPLQDLFSWLMESAQTVIARIYTRVFLFRISSPLYPFCPNYQQGIKNGSVTCSPLSLSHHK